MTQMTSNIYNTGEWPKIFIEFTMINLKRTPKAKKILTIAQLTSSHIEQSELRGQLQERLNGEWKIYLQKTSLEFT
jgi:hypothetical protein